MGTFTTSLPDSFLELLVQTSKELEIPKNKIIENALCHYLEHLKKDQYAASFKGASDDTDLMSIEKEGMLDYLNQLKHWDKTM